MKILLAKCPRSYYSHFEENSESLALAYLAAVLRRNDYEVDILDASLTGLSLDNTVNKILDNTYDLIGFTIADATFIESTVAVISILRKNGVKSHITMGGHTPTFHYKEILEMSPGLDSIAMYEGEQTILELVQCIKDNKNWRNVKSIAYKSKGSIKCNPPRHLIANLDDLPFPSRDTLPFILEHKRETGVVSMSGGRGCYMNCGFCSIKAFYTIPEGPSWRYRSNENIVQEMECLVQNFGIEEILFVDDVFVGPGEKNKKRILQLAEEINKRKLKVMLSISERADNIKEDIFKRLKEVGLRQILLGVESGSQEILNYFNKGITLQQIRKAIEILKKLDIDITVSFINFTPITTIDRLKKNIDFFVGLEINILQGLLNRFQIYGGTPLGKELQSEGLIKGKFPNFSYDTPDKRVDIIYKIAQKTLGTFLSTAYELKKVERALRIKLFEAEIGKDLKEIAFLQKERARYKNLMNKIMKEASELLLEIIKFVESKDATDKRKINKFIKEMTDISLHNYKEWLRLIQLLKEISPNLNSSEYLISRNQTNL